MDRYLNTPIKEIITKFPEVGKILEEYNIGCVPCNAGSCLLKDIIDIHNLSQEQEHKLMSLIVFAIYPGKAVKIPKIERKVKSKQVGYSPPMKRLVDEHTLIKRWLALIPQVIENLDAESKEGKGLILNGINFIRSYADKFHHAKEEEILFKYFDENLEIIKTMLTDHETARAHVRAIIEAIEKKDKPAIIEHLNAYNDLLTEHIKKEDEILYPWIDRGLSVTSVGELFSKFVKADEKADKEVIEECKRFVEEMEERTQSQKKEIKK